MSKRARIWHLRFGEGVEQDCACAEAAGGPAVGHLNAAPGAESDCACPEPDRRSDEGVGPGTGLWQRAVELHAETVDAGHVAAFNAARPAGIGVLNLSAQALLNDYTAPQPLRRARADRELAALGVLEQVGRETVPAARGHTLTAWIHVTNDCNLNCRYCYLERSPEAMDEATGEAALRTLVDEATRDGFGAVKLKYAGGEPTLNFSLVRHLHHTAREMTYASGLGLSEVLLTNGLSLTGDMLLFLRDSAIRLMI